jgi:hypothetical protein
MTYLMLRITQLTQIIFCFVSMILTSLFALSLSGVSIDDLSPRSTSGKTVFLALVFLLIGCCVDIGKYLFWSQRRRSPYYGALSFVLMMFSWLASCAFLVASEHSFLQQAQVESTEHAVVQQSIDSTTQQINYYESLLSKRLNSSYHKQWAEGQRNAEKVAALNETLLTLTKKLQIAGKEEAHRQVATTQFFTDLSQVLGSSVERVRAVGYGLLSLLLEVSTLGMISLAYAFKREAGLNHSRSGYSGANSIAGDTGNGGIEKQQAIARLTADILKGHIVPVLRKIKVAKYGLNIDDIRQVLKGLFAIGVLENDKRNSYKLAESLQNSSS